jgi:hypothetical protein
MTLVHPVPDGSPRRYWRDRPALRGALSVTKLGLSVIDGTVARAKREPGRTREGRSWR